jgi:hypothetical protein
MEMLKRMRGSWDLRGPGWVQPAQSAPNRGPHHHSQPADSELPHVKTRPCSGSAPMRAHRFRISIGIHSSTIPSLSNAPANLELAQERP